MERQRKIWVARERDWSFLVTRGLMISMKVGRKGKGRAGPIICAKRYDKDILVHSLIDTLCTNDRR